MQMTHRVQSPQRSRIRKQTLGSTMTTNPPKTIVKRARTLQRKQRPTHQKRKLQGRRLQKRRLQRRRLQSRMGRHAKNLRGFKSDSEPKPTLPSDSRAKRMSGKHLLTQNKKGTLTRTSKRRGKRSELPRPRRKSKKLQRRRRGLKKRRRLKLRRMLRRRKTG